MKRNASSIAGSGGFATLGAYVAAIRHLGPRRAWLNLVHRARRRMRSLDRYGTAKWGDLELTGRARVAFPAAEGGAVLAEGGHFSALNRARHLGSPPDWDYPETPLWLFNLHYFDYLSERRPVEARRLVFDWIERYPPRKGRPGWMPYPLSLRLRNWTKLLLASDWPQPERATVLASIEAQAACLADTVEYHLGGNHLLETGLTLKLLSACFEGQAVARWAGIGEAILNRELDEQFLPDGGHFERSPMYHALLVSGLLDLVNVLDAQDRTRERILDRLPSILAFLAALRHPDGRIALFNDSALEVAPEPGKLLAYAARLEVRVAEEATASFPDTGYSTWRRGSTAFLIDHGPLGPDYQLAHAHADVFSFELSLNGARVVVDGGTSTYDPGAERDALRSTRAHNTVEIAGADQCELFGAFRVGRRGRPRDVRTRVSEEGLELRGWHDGYRRLPGNPVHRREVRFLPEGIVLVWDSVEAVEDQPAVSRLRLAPGAVVRCDEATRARIGLPGLELTLTSFGAAVGREPGLYAPRFGERVPCEVLTLRKRDEAVFGYALAPADIPVVIDADGAEVSGRRIPRNASP